MAEQVAFGGILWQELDMRRLCLSIWVVLVLSAACLGEVPEYIERYAERSRVDRDEMLDCVNNGMVARMDWIMPPVNRSRLLKVWELDKLRESEERLEKFLSPMEPYFSQVHLRDISEGDIGYLDGWLLDVRRVIDGYTCDVEFARVYLTARTRRNWDGTHAVDGNLHQLYDNDSSKFSREFRISGHPTKGLVAGSELIFSGVVLMDGGELRVVDMQPYRKLFTRWDLARDWTSGKHTFRGVYGGLERRKVLLYGEDGKLRRVRLDVLSESDQEWVRVQRRR